MEDRKYERAAEMVKAQPKKAALNRGAWTPEEDKKLTDYVRLHGDHNWRSLPEKAGLKRCGKNCRLRWHNYLRPNIKRGNITEDEEDLIIRLHNLLGNKWSLIARRLPGRTDKEIKDYWHAHLSRRALSTEDLNRKLFINPNFSRQSFQGNDTIAAAALMCPLPVRLVPRQKCPDRFAAPATTMMAHENGDTVAHENGDTGGDGVVGAQEKDGGGSSSLDGLGGWLSAWEFNDLDKVIGSEMGDGLAP